MFIARQNGHDAHRARKFVRVRSSGGRRRGVLPGLLGSFLAGFVGIAGSEWHTEGGFRWAELPVGETGRAGFTLLAPDATGITFTNWLDESAAGANRVLLNGSGVAAGDFDNDGWIDLYFCGLNQPNVLYKNLGNWRFRDLTKETGVVCTNQFCRGAVFADLNGDGWLDLLVSTVGH